MFPVERHLSLAQCSQNKRQRKWPGGHGNQQKVRARSPVTGARKQMSELVWFCGGEGRPPHRPSGQHALWPLGDRGIWLRARGLPSQSLDLWGPLTQSFPACLTPLLLYKSLPQRARVHPKCGRKPNGDTLSSRPLSATEHSDLSTPVKIWPRSSSHTRGFFSSAGCPDNEFLILASFAIWRG